MAFDKISVVIRLHSNTFFAYSITSPLLMSFTTSPLLMSFTKPSRHMRIQTKLVYDLRKQMDTTYIKQMSFDNISVLIRLHFNTFFAYSITNLLLLLDRRHRPVSAYPPVSSYPPVPSSVVTILSSAPFHSPVDDPSCAAHLRNYPVYFISVPLCYDD
jgi:hypothetical protein